MVSEYSGEDTELSFTGIAAPGIGGFRAPPPQVTPPRLLLQF